MIVARPYTISNIRPLKGLRTSVDPNAVEKGEFSVLENFEVNRGGFIEKRRGFYRLPGTPNDRPWTLVGQPKLALIHRTAGLGVTYLMVLEGGGGALWQGTPPNNPTWTKVLGSGGTVNNPGPGTIEWMVPAGGAGAPFALQGIVSQSGVGVSTFGYDPSVPAYGVGTGSAKGTFCIVYKSRLWTLNSWGTALVGGDPEYTLRFSRPGDYSNFTGPGGGFIDINKGDGESLVSALVFNDNLYIFKNRSIWMLDASSEDQTTYSPRRVHDTLGCVGRGTVLSIDGFIYFYSAEGVYRTDGTTFEEISEPIRDQFVNEDRKSISSILRAEAVYWRNKYILNLSTTGKPLYVFDTVTETWSTWSIGGVVPVIKGMASLDEEAVSRLYAGSFHNNSWIYTTGDDWYYDDTSGLVSPGGDDTKRFAATAQMGGLDLETPGELKRNHYNGVDVVANAGTDIRMHDAAITPDSRHLKSVPDTNRRLIRFPGSGIRRYFTPKIVALTRSGQTPGPTKIFSVDTADELKQKANKNTAGTTS